MSLKPTYNELEAEIAQLRLAQNSLRDGKESYHTLLEGLPILICKCDPHLQIRFINEAYADYFQIDRDELAGKTFTSRIHEEDKDAVAGILGSLSEDNPIITLEHRVIAPDGQRRWQKWICKALYDDSGQLDGYVGIGEDITDRKETERALKESEALLQAAMDQSQAGIAIADAPNGKLRYVNEIGLGIGGAARAKLIDNVDIDKYVSSWQILHFDGTPYKEDEVPLARAIMYGEACSKEFIIRRPDEEDRIVLANAAPVFDERGDISAGIVIFLDITDRIQAQNALRKKEERYEQLFNSSNDSIFVHDMLANTASLFTEVNDVACNRLGYSREELLQMCPSDIDDAETADAARGATAELETLGHCVYKATHLRKDGTTIPVEISSRVFQSDGHFHVMSIARDITLRTTLEAQLRQAHKMEAIGTLAGGLAHDFNNILSVIAGNVSIAMSDFDLDDSLNEILSDISAGTDRAKTLTQKLLTFSSGGAPIKAAVNLNRVVEESALFACKDTQSFCELALAEDLITAEVDEAQINQMICRLVSNANQAMNEGGTIKIMTGIKEVAANSKLQLPPGYYAEIAITDHGNGIPAEALPRIFDPFFTTKHAKSGLGLSTVYSIVQKHAGQVTVDSEPGKGSIFRVYLPVISNPTPHLHVETKISHQGSGKILVMDDQEPVRLMLGRMLSNMGYNPFYAANGTQAIEIYKTEFVSEEPIKLVFLDLMIPEGMGGKNALREIRRINPAVKAIVSSGYSSDPVMANYQESGFSGVLPKPYVKAQIARVLNQVFPNSS